MQPGTGLHLVLPAAVASALHQLIDGNQTVNVEYKASGHRKVRWLPLDDMDY